MTRTFARLWKARGAGRPVIGALWRRLPGDPRRAVLAKTLGALAVALVSATPLFAGPTGGLEYTPPTAPAPPDIGNLVLRLVLMTAALVGLCVLVLWLARRTNQPAGGTGDGGGRLKHEGALALDRTCAVHLVTVDGQTVAVTTDATGLRSMVVLSDAFDVALDAAREPEPQPEVPVAPKWSADDVGQLLQRLMHSANVPGSPGLEPQRVPAAR